jgi:hypothetical protein
MSTLDSQFPNSRPTQDAARPISLPATPAALEMYTHLDFDPQARTETPVAELFLLASRLAITGKLGLKNQILNDWITNHPLTNPDDRTRVEINRLDWTRRVEGLGAEVLTELEALNRSGDPVVEVEYLEATSQCLLQIALNSPNELDKAKLLSRAITQQREACAIALSSNEVPPDKKIFYLIGLCQLRGRQGSLIAGQIDSEIESAFATCDNIVANEPIEPDYRSFLAWELPFAKAGYYRDIHMYGAATDLLAGAWLELRGTRDERCKTAVAVQYLFCALKDRQEHSAENIFKDIEAYYRHCSSGNLLEGDKKILKAELAYVDWRLART